MLRMSAAELAEFKGEKPKRKRSKFNAEKVWQDQLCFDSKGELERWNALLAMVHVGASRKIRSLRRQVTFEFFTAGIRIDRWRVDFTYEELSPVPVVIECAHCHKQAAVNWVPVAEDFTGMMTREKKRKIELFEVHYGDSWKLRITGNKAWAR